MNSRVKLENLALKKGIKQPHEKTTESLSELILKDDSLNRKEINIIAKNLKIKKRHKLSINSLLNLLRDFLIKKELNDLNLNKILKRYISINDLDRVRKLNELLHRTLKEIGELQQVRNCDKLTKEDLIYSVLRSEIPNQDKYIALVASTFDTSRLDNEIKEKINNIKQVVSRLGNLLTNKERTKIAKELHNILKKVNNKDRNTRLRNRQKQNILIKLIKPFSKKP